MLQLSLDSALPWIIAVGSVFIHWGQILGFKSQIKAKFLDIEQKMGAYEKQIEVLHKEQTETAKSLVKIETLLSSSVAPALIDLKETMKATLHNQEQMKEQINNLR